MRTCSQCIPRTLLLLLLAGSLTGCGLLAKIFERDKKETPEESESEKKEEVRSLQVAGEVASVHKAEGFVLIRAFQQGRGVRHGDVVGTLSPNGTTGSLKVTGERLGKFMAADIQEGSPSKGDLVTVRRLPGTPKPASTPLPEGPERGQEAQWMKNLSPGDL